MLNLAARWPFGLNHRNWTDCATRVLFVLFVLVFFDVWVSQTLQSWPDVWRAAFVFITDFGLAEWVLVPPLAALVLALLGLWLLPPGLWRRAALELAQLSSFIAAGIGLPGLVANLLKRAFGRARPMEFVEAGTFRFQHFVNDWTFQSFPSGHSCTAMATAFVVGFMAPRYFYLVLAIAVMTGVSRVVIGMHYPTDVVAGYVVGIAGAYFVRNFYACRRWLFAERPDATIRFRGLPNLTLALQRSRQRARA